MLVTINRPEARNAVNLAVSLGVGRALDEADRDPDVRAVVITGQGDLSFCAGADLKAVARREIVVPVDGPEATWGFAGYVSHPISKPTIAAVKGFAMGGGTEIALASDLVVAAKNAVFGLPEVKRGLFAGAGGAFRLVQQMPQKIAMELLLTGDSITSERALELGLVNRVVDVEDVVATALDLADQIASNAPLSVQATKRVALGIVGAVVRGEDPRWAQTEREARTLMSSQDAQEGPRAFAEHRAPRWNGR